MPAQHRRRTRTRRTRRTRRRNRNLFTRKRNNIAYSLKRGGGGEADPYPDEPYPTFTAVEPPFISRSEDHTPKHIAALQQYEAARKKYSQELANWRAKREKRLGRPLTFDEMHGKFGTVSVFPVPSWPARPTGPAAAAADARNYQHTPGPL
jgi:hypothetical protein